MKAIRSLQNRVRGWFPNEPLLPRKVGAVKLRPVIAVLLTVCLIVSSSVAITTYFMLQPVSQLPLSPVIPNPPTTPGLKLADWIYIKPDGSLSPDGALNVLKQDGNVYSLTSNVYNGILIQREGAVLDGAGFTMKGLGSDNQAINIDADNVTLKNMRIINWRTGILGESDCSSIIDNYIVANVSMLIRGNNCTINNNILVNTPNGDRTQDNIAVKGGDIPNCGVELDMASHFGGNFNNITNNQISGFLNGIRLWSVSHNLIAGNNLTNNVEGITLLRNTTRNTFTANNIVGCSAWAVSPVNASNNNFFGNNFIDNQKSVIDGESYKLWSEGWSLNFWDNGTVGNYWSDYQTRYPKAAEYGNSGILDTPYEIYVNNTDNYPLANPYIASDCEERSIYG